MNIIVTSSCSKQSLKQTRVILDSFGYRISKYTWSMKINQEGLLNLISLLKKKARKNNAISIFNSKNLDLIAFIGSKDQYNLEDNNKICIKRKLIMSETKNNFLEIIAKAALYHDIGKANEEFQAKLKVKLTKEENKRDLFRHELLSVLILNFLDTDYFNQSSEINYKKKFEDFLIDFIETKKEFLNLDKESFSELDMIKFLILTHHKIPTFSEQTSSLNASFSINHTYTGIEYYSLEKIKDIKNLLNENYLKLPFKELLKIKESISKFRNKFNEENMHYLMHIGRFSILSGDHYVSSKEPSDIISDSDLIAKGINEIDNIKKSQKLSNHLKLVSAFSKKFFKLFEIKDKNVFIPFSTKTKNALTKAVEKRNQKFLWQNENIDFVKNNHKSKLGFFVVSSSTGSGKTRFSARLAAEISSDQRFTTALGLKTLTIQTLNEYIHDTHILKSDATLLIGQNELVKLNEIDLDTDNLTQNKYDMDSIGGSDFESIKKYNDIYDLYFNKNLLNSKKMLISPILVCTIDYLMKAINQKNSNFLNSFLRLKNSDLILDEVDNYDLNDLIAIGKLIYLVGLFGRKVIVSTATANNNLIKYLYEMYLLGTEGSLIKDKPDFFWLTDLNQNNNFYKKTFNSKSKFNEYFEETIDSYVNLLSNNKKHKVRIRDLSLENNSKSIKEEIDFLSKNNNEKFEDKELSVGLIRIAHTKNALKLYLDLQNIDGIYPIFYHAQMFLFDRYILEKALDNLLKRKINEKNDFLLKDKELFKKILKKDINKNLKIVVIATPVEEVGRDHDFDWAIIEPSSTRSIIQTAGRVFRHRDLIPKTTNITLMNKNFRIQDNEEDLEEKYKKSYYGPGFELRENLFQVNNKGDLFSIANYLDNENNINNGLNQKHVIKPSEDLILSKKENDNIKNILFNYLDKFREANFISIFLKNKYLKENDSMPGLYINFRESTISFDYFKNEDNEIKLIREGNSCDKQLDKINDFDLNLPIYLDKEDLDFSFFEEKELKETSNILKISVPINKKLDKIDIMNLEPNLSYFENHKYLGLFQNSQLKKIGGN